MCPNFKVHASAETLYHESRLVKLKEPFDKTKCSGSLQDHSETLPPTIPFAARVSPNLKQLYSFTIVRPRIARVGRGSIESQERPQLNGFGGFGRASAAT